MPYSFRSPLRGACRGWREAWRGGVVCYETRSNTSASKSGVFFFLPQWPCWRWLFNSGGFVRVYTKWVCYICPSRFFFSFFLPLLVYANVIAASTDSFSGRRSISVVDINFSLLNYLSCANICMSLRKLAICKKIYDFFFNEKYVVFVWLMQAFMERKFNLNLEFVSKRNYVAYLIFGN